MKANVYVTLKKGVLDPQGKAVKSALNSLGFKEVMDLRVGKFIEITIDGAGKREAKKRLEEMCRNILTNPVIEDFRVEIEE
ncbi:MAG: phosphoribosylformylglycinamidine synthase subunit PurS [Deltaproteobacteria bacterium]|nr:phosphoribosylformylglycinamidine synthase subunit PurS [Deltaproteobacteria bacterium]